EARVPLAFDVADHAVAAAFDDPRVPAVVDADFPEMSVKVSVIGPSEPVAARAFDELRKCVRPGVDGLTIESGSHQATLLPSVWPKVVDTDEFLDALWRKAGLRPGAWPRSIKVSRYGTVEECDPGPRPGLRR